MLARYDVAGNLDQAIAQLERAVALDANYTLAHAALGEACWRKSRATGDASLAARAIAHGERAVALDPSLPTVHTSLAAIYTTSGREQDAIRELKEALRLAPASAEAKRELARVYVALGRFPEAETAYKEAIAARPTDWYGYLLLGLLYHQQLERYDDAAAAYRRAAELTPDNDLVHRNLGLGATIPARPLRPGRHRTPALAPVEIQRHHLRQPRLGLLSPAPLRRGRHRRGNRPRSRTPALLLLGQPRDLRPRTPGSEAKSAAAFAKAIELAAGLQGFTQ